jgi:hypothetical protein
MTNFSELKKQNPLSFRLFEQWVERNYETTLNIWNGTIRNEDVVEFLDHNRTMIEVFAVDAWDNWMFRIVLEDITAPFFVAYQDEDEYKTRQKATTQAIAKAFELLENKLKQN